MTHKKQQVPIDQFPHVQRWFATVRERPAVQRGLAVGRELGSPNKGMDEEARKHLFGGASNASAAPGPSA
ncbi:MAG: hypothetical protein EOO29_22705 [Comamonadaceae bacterium]|nr:MAG: hypothetical protein EOO29_22705 [Comamonadaceae bacterium]